MSFWLHTDYIIYMYKLPTRTSRNLVLQLVYRIQFVVCIMTCIIEVHIELRKLWQKNFKVTRIRRCCEVDIIIHILFIHVT